MSDDDEVQTLRSAWPLLGALLVLGVLLGGAYLLGRDDPGTPAPAKGYALDVASPWPERGTVPASALTGLPAPWSSATRLFAQVRKGSVEVVLLDPGARRWAVAVRPVAQASAWDVQPHALPDRPVGLLVAVLPEGVTGRRALAVAAPAVDGIDRISSSRYSYATPLTRIGAGVAEGALTQEQLDDSLVARKGKDVVAAEAVPGTRVSG
ncbi:MAG: hypothetical protein JWN17_2385 [Frankiales bacterium]|nr:hypothetical protein [Frankiales bacterium]